MKDKQSLIFIVDDDQGMLRLMEKTLQREGFTTATAASASEAIAWLHGQQPALMVLDLSLMESKEVINHLTPIGSLMPFVVVTGHGDERTAVEMMKRGALDYVVKDVEFQELVCTVVRHSLQQLERERTLDAAERSLRQEHEFASAILSASGALMIVVDSRGHVVHFNRASEILSGYTASEVQDQVIWEVLAPTEERELVRQAYHRILTGDNLERSESHWVTRTGDLRLISWSRTALRDVDGALRNVIASGLDITETRRLEREVLHITELERRRIGQDLHDGLCQHLAGIELMVQALEQTLTKSSKAHARRAAEIAAQVRESIRQTKQLARGLSPVALEETGLMSALHELSVNVSAMFHVPCTFRCERPIPLSDNAAATHLFRIAQEAVSNAIRHGRAKSIEIVLQKMGQKIFLLVHDDGVGLPKDGGKKTGMGLRIMQYRAGLIRGSLAVQRRKEGGTTVVCSVYNPG